MHHTFSSAQGEDVGAGGQPSISDKDPDTQLVWFSWSFGTRCRIFSGGSGLQAYWLDKNVTLAKDQRSLHATEEWAWQTEQP